MSFFFLFFFLLSKHLFGFQYFDYEQKHVMPTKFDIYVLMAILLKLFYFSALKNSKIFGFYRSPIILL